MDDSTSLEIGFIGKARRTAVLVLSLEIICALALNRAALAGLLLGAAISIGSFEYYRLAARALLRPNGGRRARLWLYAVWWVKWPALWVLLYWAMGRWGMSPEWLCAGLSVIPVAVMLLAGVALASGARRRTAAAEAGQ